MSTSMFFVIAAIFLAFLSSCFDKEKVKKPEDPQKIAVENLSWEGHKSSKAAVRNQVWIHPSCEVPVSNSSDTTWCRVTVVHEYPDGDLPEVRAYLCSTKPRGDCYRKVR